MKRRHRQVLNLFSIGLLLIALYLNFVKKETNDVSITAIKGTSSKSTSHVEVKSMVSKEATATLVMK